MVEVCDDGLLAGVVLLKVVAGVENLELLPGLDVRSEVPAQIKDKSRQEYFTLACSCP